MRILLLAQVPPPYHGQSIMQKYLIDIDWQWCQKEFIRLDLSDKIEIVGNFNINKLYKLFRIILKVLTRIGDKKVQLVYYPPASPHRIPFYRDIVLIPILKLISEKLIFHFHSGGFNSLYYKLNVIEKKIAKKIYSNCSEAIVLLPSLMKEVEWISPSKIVSVPNGISDEYDVYPLNKKEFPSILFVGNLKREKGLLDLLKAINNLNFHIELNVIGGWHNKEFKDECLEYIIQNRIEKKINFCGIKTGSEKWKYYSNSNYFCLPTYENEAMPITLLEAMMFKLPIITTNWRAIPDIVSDGEEGFLVPINSPNIIAKKIELLAKNKNLSEAMGKKGREKFLREFTLEKHLSRMEMAFKELLSDEK